MIKNKTDRQHGLRFILSTVTAVNVLAAIAAYITGTSYFTYYGDLNPIILILTVAGAVLCIASSVMADKTDKMLIPSMMTIAASLLLAVSLMMIIDARVYSFAVLMLSDLERDNVEGYYALYCSIGAMGLISIAILINFIAAFLHGHRKTVGNKEEGANL